MYLTVLLLIWQNRIINLNTVYIQYILSFETQSLQGIIHF